MLQDPALILNRSLSAIGKPALELGSITDASRAGREAQKIYGPTLRQLLRTAHWSFARRHTRLQLLGSRDGHIPPDALVASVPDNTGLIPTTVEWPWQFAYAWPIDGVQARWLPQGHSNFGNTAPPGNISIGNTPMMTGLQQTGAGPWLNSRPARFLVSNSSEFPVVVAGLNGPPDWDQLGDLDDIEGVGIRSRRIVLTNVPNAFFVYTGLIIEIEMWDDLFQQAMVAACGERLAMPLIDDPKERLSVRQAQIAIAKDAIREARTASANEAGFPQSTDQTPDWIQARRARAGYGAGWDASGGGGPGYTHFPWTPYSFGDQGVY